MTAAERQRAHAAYDAAQAALDDAKRNKCDVSTRIHLEDKLRTARFNAERVAQPTRWVSQIGNVERTHATRHDAVKHVTEATRVATGDRGEGLVVLYDLDHMPLETTVIRHGRIVREAK